MNIHSPITQQEAEDALLDELVGVVSGFLGTANPAARSAALVWRAVLNCLYDECSHDLTPSLLLVEMVGNTLPGRTLDFHAEGKEVA